MQEGTQCYDASDTQLLAARLHLIQTSLQIAQAVSRLVPLPSRSHPLSPPTHIPPSLSQLPTSNPVCVKPTTHHSTSRESLLALGSLAEVARLLKETMGWAKNLKRIDVPGGEGARGGRDGSGQDAASFYEVAYSNLATLEKMAAEQLTEAGIASPWPLDGAGAATTAKSEPGDAAVEEMKMHLEPGDAAVEGMKMHLEPAVEGGLGAAQASSIEGFALRKAPASAVEAVEMAREVSYKSFLQIMPPSPRVSALLLVSFKRFGVRIVAHATVGQSPVVWPPVCGPFL